MSESSEFDKLAKDSAGGGDDDNDDKNSPTKEEKWIMKFLDKISPLLKTPTDMQRFKLGRKFCEYIFHRANFNGDTMIHVCVKSDDLNLMDRLYKVLHKFQLYELLNLPNYNKETGVHLACALNKTGQLQEMLNYAADVNANDTDGNTPLHIAIHESHDECVAIILNVTDIDVNLSIANDNGYTPLHVASMKNNLNVVKMLNAKASSVKRSIFDDVEGKHGNSALHIAIESNAREVAEYLIKNKCVSPSKTNKSGHTALYLARVARANWLISLMQRYNLIDSDRLMDDDDDDASSKDSFESQETVKVRRTYHNLPCSIC